MFHADIYTDDLVSGAVGQSQHYGFRNIARWEVERLPHDRLVDAFLLLADIKVDAAHEEIRAAEERVEAAGTRIDEILQESDEIEKELSRIAYALPDAAPQGLFAQLDAICERLRILGCE